MNQSASTPLSIDQEASGRSLFLTGFKAMAPLWAGAIPAGAAFGVIALDASLTAVETVLMSSLVFTSAGQVSAVAFLAEQASNVLIVATVAALNIQLVLLGLAIGRQLQLRGLEKVLTAWFLTDGSFAIAAGRGPLRMPVLVGAGVSMYVGWNLGTVLGVVAGRAVADVQALGVALIVPLCFLAVLAPLLRSMPAAAAALGGVSAALALVQVVPSGVAVLGGGLAGCGLGALLERSRRGSTEEE